MTAIDGRPGLRPAGPGDAELLYRIYASTREDEFAVVPWDAPAKEAFLRMQFAAQDTHYRAAFPDASYDLIVSGADVLGRLYVDRGETAWQVIDLSLLPRHRGKGIGTRLLTDVLAHVGAPDAGDSGGSVRRPVGVASGSGQYRSSIILIHEHKERPPRGGLSESDQLF